MIRALGHDLLQAIGKPRASGDDPFEFGGPPRFAQ